MDGENVETLVDSEQVFIPDGEEGAAGCKGSNERGGLNWHKTSSRCYTHKACNDTGAEPNDGKFASERILQQNPGDATTACGKISIAHNVDGPNRDVGSGCAYTTLAWSPPAGQATLQLTHH